MIPLWIQIWDTNFNTVPAGYGWAYYALYYWNNNSNSWIYYTSFQRYTGGDGRIDIGFAIPYNLANNFYIYGTNERWIGNQWASQYYYKYFSVSWN